MAKQYGMPYMGSKAKIVNLIQYVLNRHPNKKYFIDLFTGGFAVSHYVLENTKMKVLANDKNKYVIALLDEILNKDSINFKQKAYEWVSRELFMDVRNNPNNYPNWYVGYILTIWSFGNSQRAYLFGKDIEEIKRQGHEMIVNNVYGDLVSDLEKVVPKEIQEIDYKTHKDKRIVFMGYVKNYLKDDRLQQLQQLRQLERLQGLERLPRSVALKDLDWKDFINSLDKETLENAIIYCDPPYENTGEYMENRFNHDEFWEWFRTTPYCVYASSYQAPSDITPVNFDLKLSLLQGGAGKIKEENIYWNGKGELNETLLDLLFNQ